MPVGGPLEIVDPTGEDLELLLQNEFVAGPPDPDGPGHVGGGDPLAVGGVAGHGGGVGVLGVDRDVKRVVEVDHNYGSAIRVQNGVGFGVAGDQDSPAALGGWDGRVGFCELGHFRGNIGEREREKEWGI